LKETDKKLQTRHYIAKNDWVSRYHFRAQLSEKQNG